MHPTISTSFEYDGATYLADWYDITSKATIPDIAWQQAYVVGNVEGLIPLVTNANSPNPYNLPGGRVESSESLEKTMQRELEEECNMRILSWEPLGYQLVTDKDGVSVAQFRAYAVLEKIGEFSHDPGGPVIANTLIPFNELEEHIQHGDIGIRLMELSKQHFIDQNQDTQK